MNNPPTPYDRIGGEAAVRKLVTRFYDLMSELPEARDVLAMHPVDLASSREKLFDFLSGPYQEKVEPIIPHLVEAADSSAELSASVEAMTNSLRATLTGLAAVAGPEGQALVDQSGLTVQRPEVCLPMPGTRC